MSEQQSPTFPFFFGRWQCEWLVIAMKGEGRRTICSIVELSHSHLKLCLHCDTWQLMLIEIITVALALTRSHQRPMNTRGRCSQR